jgi:hypothetical protein
MSTKSESHHTKPSRIIKVQLADELRRRAEYAKIDHELDWSELVGRAVEMFLDSLDAAEERSGFEELAAALMRDDDAEEER